MITFVRSGNERDLSSNIAPAIGREMGGNFNLSRVGRFESYARHDLGTQRGAVRLLYPGRQSRMTFVRSLHRNELMIFNREAYLVTSDYGSH